ncbi:MAG TPA: tRNA (adenosine(37)-N6)-threonylcarbamoyltransferase complex dimerization subunit type 1 TsaB [Verrucomicrobiae bacterium]
MTILALEFCSSQRSVALARGGRVLAEASETGGRETHAFGMIEKILTAANIGRAEIECIAVGMGPGSYTGIRVALSIAQGWQLATSVKLLGIGSVNCLAAQAQAAKMLGRVTVVIDAQRGEFYQATYEITAEMILEIEPLRIVNFNEPACEDARPTIFVGPEIQKWFPSGKVLFPEASMLATLAMQRTDFAAGEKLEPIYLREANFVKAPPARTMVS